MYWKRIGIVSWRDNFIVLPKHIYNLEYRTMSGLISEMHYFWTNNKLIGPSKSSLRQSRSCNVDEIAYMLYLDVSLSAKGKTSSKSSWIHKTSDIPPKSTPFLRGLWHAILPESTS